jgi:hypothetical protein
MYLNMFWCLAWWWLLESKHVATLNDNKSVVFWLKLLLNTSVKTSAHAIRVVNNNKHLKHKYWNATEVCILIPIVRTANFFFNFCKIMRDDRSLYRNMWRRMTKIKVLCFVVILLLWTVQYSTTGWIRIKLIHCTFASNMSCFWYFTIYTSLPVSA